MNVNLHVVSLTFCIAEKEPSGIDVLNHAMKQFVKSAKEKLGDVKYKYLPPKFDKQREYDSDEEAGTGVAVTPGTDSAAGPAGKMNRKQRALVTMLRSMKSLASAVNNKLEEIREEEDEIAAAEAEEDVESDFSDWEVPSDYDSDNGGAPIRRAREKSLFGAYKQSQPGKKAAGGGAGGDSASSDDESKAASKPASTRGTPTKTARTFMQGVAKFVTNMTQKLDAIERKHTARSSGGASDVTDQRTTARSQRPVAAAAAAVQPTRYQNDDYTSDESDGGAEGDIRASAAASSARRALSTARSAASAQGSGVAMDTAGGGGGQLSVDTGYDGSPYQYGEYTDDGGYGYDTATAGYDPAVGYYDESGNWIATDGYYDESGNWVPSGAGGDEYGYWDEGGNYVSMDVGGGVDTDAVDADAPVDYGAGVSKTAVDPRSPDQIRLDASEAVVDKQLKMYSVATVAAEQQREARKWLEAAQQRLADPLRRPVRMATAPKDRITAAVQAHILKEEVMSQHSRKAQYYERMQLKDEEFAFTDEDGLPTVEIVGDFSTTVRVLALDTDELLKLRDGFRRVKGREELGVSINDLARFGKAEFDMEPCADSFMSVVNQTSKVRLGYKLWIELMVRLCCLPRERLLKLVFRAFDSSGVGKFGLTGAARCCCDIARVLLLCLPVDFNAHVIVVVLLTVPCLQTWVAW